MEETFRQKIERIWRMLKGQKFKNGDVRPLLIVLVCAIAATLIYTYDSVYFTVDYDFIEGFIYTSLINALRIMEMAIYLKIALAILKKRSKFNLLLWQTVLFMSAFVIISAAADVWIIEEALKVIFILSAAVYCFLLINKKYGVSRVHSMIISAIYLLLSSERVLPAILAAVFKILEILTH